jgi:hypothetical protein
MERDRVGDAPRFRRRAGRDPFERIDRRLWLASTTIASRA